MTHQIRDALQTEIEPLAQLWHAGWYDAHAAIVPAALVEQRTLDSFRERTAKHLPVTRVTGPANNPVGFCMTHDDELFQLYVSDEGRGTGAAAALVADCEAQLINQNIPLAWLSCAIGNHRAARFYEKCGWVNAATETHHLETLSGPFPLEVWRFEKRMGQDEANP